MLGFASATGLLDLVADYTDLITNADNTEFINIDRRVGERAAQLRAQYHLTLPHALQVASALTYRCDAFLTNDIELRRITDIRVLVLGEITLH
jgi:predicted nucleic acid-binding protein